MMKTQTIMIKDEYIKLGQAMKLAGLVENGARAKEAIAAKEVFVNGEVETRRGRKLYKRDIFSYNNESVIVG